MVGSRVFTLRGAVSYDEWYAQVTFNGVDDGSCEICDNIQLFRRSGNLNEWNGKR